MVADIATIGIAVDTRQVDRANNSLDRLGREADNTQRATSRLERQFSNLNTTASPLVGTMAKLGSAFSAAAITNSIVQSGLAMDKFNIGLKAATGSSEKAKEMMIFLQSETQRLGIDFQAAAESFTQLSAAAKGTALEGDKTKYVFTAIAEASSVMQLSADQTKGAITALQQMISKGTVSSEELRGQLGERLPGAFQIAARAMGVTTQQLGKMLEQGEVVASDFLPRFAKQLRKEMGDGLKDAIESPLASINRLKNALFSLGADTAGGGFLKGLGKGAEDLANTLADPKIKEAAVTLGEGLGKALSALAPVIRFVAEHLEELGIILGAYLGGKVFGMVIKMLASLGTGFMTFVGLIKDVTVAVGAAAAGGSRLINVLKMVGTVLLATPWGRVAALIAAVGVGAYKLYEHFTEAEESATTLKMAMPPLAKSTQDYSKIEEELNDTLNKNVKVTEELLEKRKEATAAAILEAEQMKRILDAYKQSNDAGERMKDRVEVENKLKELKLKYGDQEAKQMVTALEQAKQYEKATEAIIDKRKEDASAAEKQADDRKGFLKSLDDQIQSLRLESEYFGKSNADKTAAELKAKALALGLGEEATARIANVQSIMREIELKEEKKKKDEEAAQLLEKEKEQIKDLHTEYLDLTQSNVEQLERWKTETLAKVSQTTEGYQQYARDVEEIFNKRLPEAKQKDLESSKNLGDGITRAFQKYAEDVNDFASLSERVFTSMFTGMEDAMVSFVTKGEFDFKKMADSIIADMTRIAIRQMFIKPLMGFLGFADGGVFSGGSVVPFADGGVVGSPTLFPMTGGKTGLMGEAGPEAIMPLTRTAGGELGVRAIGGGGGVVLNTVNNITVNGGSNGSQQDGELARQIAKEVDRTIEAKVNASFLKQMRPGNLLNSGISV